MAAALVAGVAGLGGAVTNSVVGVKLQRAQLANTQKLEDQKGEIATNLQSHRGAIEKKLGDQMRRHEKELADHQRGHDTKLAAVRSELRGVEREAEQLMAHSLGLEAEQRRNFEAKRAEVCDAAFASLVALMEGLLVVVVEGPQLDDAALPREVIQERMRAKESAGKLATAATARVQLAGLYTTEALAQRMQSLALFAWSAITTESETNVKTATNEFRKGLEEVRGLVRVELGYPLVRSSEDDTAPCVGVQPEDQGADVVEASWDHSQALVSQSSGAEHESDAPEGR